MASNDDSALDGLTDRRAPIEIDPDEFRAAGHRLVDAIAEHLQGIRRRPVNCDISPSRLRELLPAGPVPELGEDPGKLLDETFELLVEHSLFNGHPRFFGYITASPAPIGVLADLIAAAVNPNLGGWQLAPVATEIELQTVRWIGDLIGYPAGGGLLVSGGNQANFAGFLAARGAAGGDRLKTEGAGSGDRLLAYASAETHTWLQKAADLFGVGTDAVRWIETRPDQTIDTDALRRQIASDRADGARPFVIVGSAGTAATGAIDPLAELAEIARANDAWFHVDGAYGALAAAVPDWTARFAGMAEADSIAVDPHKWLYAPLEAGCILVRDAEALQRTFGYTPSYYHFAEPEVRTNLYEYGMQNSRGFRALKVWLALRQVGRAGYEQMIGDDIRLARALHRAIEATPELEAMTCSLSIVTFRYRFSGDEERVNERNERLLERLKVSGEAFISNAVVDGQFLLRACICNFRTTLADVEALPGIVVRHAQEPEE